MVQAAMCEIKGGKIPLARAHSSSLSALRAILEEYALPSAGEA